jgi:hypothetical protein
VGPQLLPIINLGAPAIVEALLKLVLPPLPGFLPPFKSKLQTLLEYFKEAGREAVNLGKVTATCPGFSRSPPYFSPVFRAVFLSELSSFEDEHWGIILMKRRFKPSLCSETFP